MDEITTKLRNVEVAREALVEANERLSEVRQRREVAINAMIDYALAAYVDNESIESIMDAVEFAIPEEGSGPPPFIAQMLGIESGGSRVQAFAQWLGQVMAERIMERHAAENQE